MVNRRNRGRDEDRGKRGHDGERPSFGPFAKRGKRGHGGNGEQRALRDAGGSLGETEPIDGNEQRSGKRDDSGGSARANRAPGCRGVCDDEIVLVEEARDKGRER